MKRNRLSAAVGVLVSLAIGAAFFFGTLKIADVHAQRQGYVEKRVVSTGTATGLSAFANQLAPDPTTGMCLQADASNRSVWGPCGSLPSGGTPGQVAGVTVFSTGTVTATGWTAANGTIFAGSNVALSTGTNTTTGTSANLSDGPRVHAVGFEPTLPSGGPGEVLCYVGTGTNTTTSKAACAQSTGAAYVFSTSTPAAVATSGSVGTSTLLVRSDHVHQGDGDSKVAAYSGQTPDYLENVTRSSDSSITLAEFSGDLDIRANFGTAANTVCMGNDSRLSNARAPTAHASTHLTGAGDPIAVVTDLANGLAIAQDHTAINMRSATPTANYIPVANGSGKLTAWISPASWSAAGLMSQTHYSMLDTASATPRGSGLIPRADAHGLLHRFSPLFAETGCTSNSADITVTSSGTTTLATVGLATSDYYGANGLKFTYHFSGYATGGASAIVNAWVLVGLGTPYKIPCTQTVSTAAYGYAVVLSATCIAWNASWAAATPNYYLQTVTSSGSFLIPLNTQSGAYSACFTVEGLNRIP